MDDRQENSQSDELKEYMMRLENMGIIKGFSEWLQGEKKDERFNQQTSSN